MMGNGSKQLFLSQSKLWRTWTNYPLVLKKLEAFKVQSKGPNSQINKHNSLRTKNINKTEKALKLIHSKK